MRRSRCFVFDRQSNLRDSDTSKPKRTVTPFMYMCLKTAFLNKSAIHFRHCKYNNFYLYKLYSTLTFKHN